MNATEAERRQSIQLAPGQMVYAILPLRPMREELVKLVEHAEYLANSGAHLAAHADELANRFAKDVPA